MKPSCPRQSGLSFEPAENADSQSAPWADHNQTNRDLCLPYRWWVEALGPDETFRSLAERADRFHGEPPPDTPYAWQGSSSYGNCDAPNAYELLRLARMLNVPAAALFKHRLQDGPHLIYPTERRAYCPQCIREDQMAGRPRAFRREWARFFVLSCSSHGITLHWAEPRLSALKDMDVEMQLHPEEPWQQELVSLIDQFALTLESCLWSRAPWPTNWYGTPGSTRAYLARHLCNLIGERAKLPINYLWTDTLTFPFVAVPKRSMLPLDEPAWESVRRIGRPAWRRAALWLTAWKVIPGLPARWRPITFPERYLEEVDEWWEGFPAPPQMFKQLRTYVALRKSCIPVAISYAKQLPLK
jgi:hypothetical protein